MEFSRRSDIYVERSGRKHGRSSYADARRRVYERRPSTEAGSDGRFAQLHNNGGNRIGEVFDSKGKKRYVVPAGLDTSSWDQDVAPICFGCKVFDLQSFMKWTYDWTCVVYGARSDEGDRVGDLWLTVLRLNRLIGWLEYQQRRRGGGSLKGSNYELQCCLSDGLKIWNRFMELIGSCEEWMKTTEEWEESGRMGGKASKVFVRSLTSYRYNGERTDQVIRRVRNFEEQMKNWTSL